MKIAIVNVLILGISSSSLLADVTAFWKFDNSGHDYSGNNNQLSLNGVSFSTDRFGRINSAGMFDGQSFAYSSSNIGVTGNSNRTVSLWLKINSQQDYAMSLGYPGQLIGWGNPGHVSGGGFALFYEALNNVYSGNQNINFGALAFYRDANFEARNEFALNQWNNVALTYGGSMGSYRLYINGESVGQPILDGAYTNSSETLDTENGQVVIGGGGSSGLDSSLDTVWSFDSSVSIPSDYHGFRGSMDDVMIFNTELSSDEVRALYNVQSVPEPSALSLLAIGLGGLAMMRRRRS